MKTIIHFLISTLAILITAYILPGVFVSGFWAAFVLAVILGAINTVIRPILILLTLPLTILTFGLFALVINALLVLLASYIVPGFTIVNFWWAFVFGIVLAMVNFILQTFEKK
ncbi:MAG: phage holin family protein [Candidatus Paceibacterota bacterium]|jgi:putative membrane protein